jgi:hypothetical protein
MLIKPLSNNISLINKFVNAAKNTPPFWIIFVALSSAYLGIAPNGNEEHYLQVAKACWDESWISSPNSLQQHAANRIIYQYLAGYLLDWFSFETTVFLIRIFLIIGFSVVLSQLYRFFQISQVYILLHLVVLFLPWQSFFGGSWLFLSAEPKCFAYLFSIGSIYLIFVKKYGPAIGLLIFASYFHVLATLYLFGYGIIAAFLSTAIFSKRLLVKGIFIYLISILPIIYFTYSATQIEYSSSNTPSASWIYTFFRNPHHLAFHYDTQRLFSQHIPGILISLLTLPFAVGLYFYFKKNPTIQFITQFVIVSLVGSLLSLFFLFWDQEGTWLKFHLFRVNTWSVFWIFFLFSLWLKRGITESHQKLAERLILLIGIFFFSKSATLNVFNHLNYNKDKKGLENICIFIRKHTEKDAVILSFIDDLRLNRWTRRDRFVEFKFIPSDFSAIQNWYKRVLDKKEALSDPSNLENLVCSYSIQYILAKQPLEYGVLQRPIFHSNGIWLYKAEENCP